MTEQTETRSKKTPCPRCGTAMKVTGVEVTTTADHTLHTQYFRCTNRKCPITEVAETVPMPFRPGHPFNAMPGTRRLIERRGAP